MPGAEIVAAGAVVTRKSPRKSAGKSPEKSSGTHEVLLVHRPKYDDWSFPKGKVDPGEHVTAAAVREVAEETGLDIRLGPPLRTQRYLVANGTQTKAVHYWAARVVGGDDVSSYSANDEIDQVRWLDTDRAATELTYDDDRETLAELSAVGQKTYPLVVLRHARAQSRRSWNGNDRERPLSRVGEFQAEHVVPVLGAFGVQRLLSSSSLRCWRTVAPYADVADVEIEVTDGLSQEDATPESVEEQVRRLLADKESSTLCTHRPVLPWVFDALGLENPGLEPGSVLVVHHRRGKVVATERHPVTYR